MSAPNRNNLGIVLYLKGDPQTTYETRYGQTVATELISTSYASMATGYAAEAAVQSVGLAEGSSYQVSVVLGGVTSIEVRMMGSMDGATWSPIQTMNGTSGSPLAVHSISATSTVMLQTASSYSLPFVRWEAKSTGGAISATTAVIIRGSLGV